MDGEKKGKYSDLIRRFATAQILVIGDVILDTYLDCRALGVASEAPVPLLEISKQTHTLGGAANVAHNLAKLGVKTSLLGLVGNDPNGRHAAQLIQESGINFLPLLTSRPTLHKSRVLSGRHYFLRLDEEEPSPLTEREATAFLEEASKAIRNSKVVLVSDYDKGMFTAALAKSIEALSIQHGIPIFGDIKPQNISHWTHLSLITPNQIEARKLFSELTLGVPELQNNLELARGLSQRLSCDIVLKMAEKGLIAVAFSGEAYQFQALCRAPENVSGAGDTVLSTLAAVLAVKAGLREAAFLANLAASIAVSHPGTHAVSDQELLEKIKDLDVEDEGEPS